MRKNQNDLPKDNDEKLCFYEKGKVVARYDSEYSSWKNACGDVIAWCELPKFEEDKND